MCVSVRFQFDLIDVINLPYAVQNEDEMELPGKNMLHWKSPTPIPVFDFGHAIQRDDHTKQPPEKDTLVQSPQALRSDSGLHITKLDLLPCTSDMADAYSSLSTTVQLIASGLCLAYFLASHPGLWPWSPGRDLSTCLRTGLFLVLRQW